jgi:hypothetical protein
MATFCLTKDLANVFRQKLKTGEIDPIKLSQMTSEDRHAFFKDFLGEDNAKQVNSLFESKLLLKNQQQGMISWAKRVAGISKTTRTDLIDRITKLDRVFNPQDEKAFLKDLASTKLGADVSLEESKKVFDLSQESTRLKNDLALDPTNKQKQQDYGMSVMKTTNYVNEIAPKDTSLANNIRGILNIPRSIVATFDVSAPFRHAWGSMSRGAFWKNYVKMYQYLGSQKAFDEKMAQIIGHPDYKLLQDANVRISDLTGQLSKREDEFMSPLLDKIPLLKGSERSYVGFLNGLRADLFYNMVGSARLAGENVEKGSPVLEDLGRVVNAFTGTADVGKFESASEIANAVNFSFRKTGGDITMMNPLTYIKGSKTARQEALRSMIGSLGISVGLLTGAKLAGFGVETDPRSSDFGKIKIGDKRIDVTGGRASLLTLLARVITGQSKSTTTGVISTMGQGYKPQTRMGTILNWERNKLSPTASAIVDMLVGTDFSGNKTTLQGEAYRLFTPMLIQDAIDLSNSNHGIDFMGTALSLFGIPTTSYSASTSDWSQSPTKAQQAFQAKVSSQTFQQANQDYNDTVSQKLTKLQQDPRYTDLSPADQQKVVTKLKANIEKSIFKKYKFTYHAKKTKKNKTITSLAQ